MNLRALLGVAGTPVSWASFRDRPQTFLLSSRVWSAIVFMSLIVVSGLIGVWDQFESKIARNIMLINTWSYLRTGVGRSVRGFALSMWCIKNDAVLFGFVIGRAMSHCFSL